MNKLPVMKLSWKVLNPEDYHLTCTPISTNFKKRCNSLLLAVSYNHFCCFLYVYDQL